MNRSDATSRDFVTGTLIVTLCCAAAIYFPLFGFISFLLLPLPVMVYRIKLGRNAGGLIPALSLMMVTVFSGGMTPDFWLMLGMLGQGFLLGECVGKDCSVEKTILISSGAILLGGFLLLAMIGNVAGTGGVDLLSEYIRKNLDATLEIYRQLDVPEENARVLADSLDRIHYVLIRIMPALVASILVFAAWLNLLLGRYVLRQNRGQTPAFERLNTWQAPDGLVWGVIGCALLLFMRIEALKFTGLNVMIVLLMVYMFQGLGILSFYFERKKVPLFLRTMIYGIIALQQILVILVIGVGFFDTWINFRRLNTGNPEHPST